MAGVSKIWVSSTKVSPTNPTGLITGFTETEWFLLDVFQNESSYTGDVSLGIGGIQYQSTVSYSIRKLADNVLKLTNDLAMSYGFSLVVQVGDKGIFASTNGWSVEYTGSNAEQRINFVTSDSNRPRFLTPDFFDRFRELEPPIDASILTINGDPVTIGGLAVTIG